MFKTIVTTIIIFVWTLMCVYGTYWNTIKSAEIHTIECGYEVVYHNTGETHIYELSRNN